MRAIFWALAVGMALTSTAPALSAETKKAAAKKPTEAECALAFGAARTGGAKVPTACIAGGAGYVAPPRQEIAQPVAPVPSPACAKLESDYEFASKQMAMNFAQGVGDRSAVRATMREGRNSNVLEQARLTLDLMRGNNCKMPTEAPNMSRYLSPALACQTDIYRQGGQPATCDMSNWVPKP